jgi:hypothetical protein
VYLYYEMRYVASKSGRLPMRKNGEHLRAIIDKARNVHVVIRDPVLGIATADSMSSDETYDIQLHRMFCSCRHYAAGFVCSHLRATAEATGGLAKYAHFSCELG